MSSNSPQRLVESSNRSLKGRAGRLALGLPLLGVLVFACTSPVRDDIVIGGYSGDQSFGATDASAAAPDATEALSSCPSTECPEGRVTCPNNPFPCAVDLSSDDDNCGACGVRCPTDSAFLSRFNGMMRCVAGTCRLVCRDEYADCNNSPDDGCEVHVFGINANDKNNCGACGNVCDDRCTDGSCGCRFGQTLCPDGICYDLDRNNANCGACGNVCPPSADPPFPPEWAMTRRCNVGRCNQPACAFGRADCNDDFLVPGGDGCETSTLFDVNNCGSCGNKCMPGETCSFGVCDCPCGSVCFTSIDSDINNCGTCGLRCPGDWRAIESTDDFAFDPAHGKPICDQGMCGYACTSNWGDCDGDIGNGCEANLLEDPMNCGGCGIHCDSVEGQPCVDGRCLTKECEIR